MSHSTQSFQIDKNLIYSLITRQASSVHKALSELVSNSFDSQATTIDIKLDVYGFCVTDDGIGFRSREEIDSFFATIGFDHSESQLHNSGEKFGFFGMGRLQIMAHASTLWRTNTFSMDVDIKSRGLEFDIEENLAQLDGCTIEGRFYQPLRYEDLSEIVKDLTHMLKYFPIPLTINGLVINRNENWQLETDDLKMKRTQSGGLAVYNCGVYVQTLPAYKFGSGIAVSKKHLALNMARNEVITTGECPIWPQIVEFLKQDVKRRDKTKVLNNDDRARLIREAVSLGSTLFNDPDLASLKLFRDINKRYHSYNGIMQSNRKITIHDEAYSKQIAEQIHENTGVLVLDPIILEWAEMPSLEHLIEAVNTPHGQPDIIDFKQLTQGIDTNYLILKDNALTKTELVILKSLRTGFRELQVVVHQHLKSYGFIAESSTFHERKLCIGECKHALAWTDSLSYVCINRSLVNKISKSGFQTFSKLAYILIHELTHSTSNLDDNSHGHDFYLAYHELVMNAHPQIYTFIRTSVSRYTQLLPKSNLVLSKYDMRDLQRELDMLEALKTLEHEED